MPSSNVILLRAVPHPKAHVFIVFTLPGIITEVVYPPSNVKKNALAPILETVCPAIQLGILTVLSDPLYAVIYAVLSLKISYV